MKMKVYAVRDTQADATMRPVFFERDEVAIRSFKLSIANADDPMNANPVDFTLFRLGKYDDELMALEGEEPYRLMNGLEAISQREFDLEQIAALHKEIDSIKNNGAGPLTSVSEVREEQDNA